MIATNIFYNFVGFRYSPPLTHKTAAADRTIYRAVALLNSLTELQQLAENTTVQ